VYLFLKCNYDGKAEFSASLLQSSVSHSNHFNMLMRCSRNMSYYYQFWKQLFCLIFLC